ncbi:lipopolysaccharide biosynthesis protein [Agromyces bauzanensis]
MTATTPGRSTRAVATLAVATLVAGVIGYIVLWLVAAVIGPAAYAQFAVFWATLYLIIGGLNGIQQEVTRATHPLEAHEQSRGSSTPVRFAIAAALAVGVICVATGPLWAPDVFPGTSTWDHVPQLALGAVGYTIVGVIAGTLYGIRQWVALAWMVGLDAALRLALVSIAIAAGGGTAMIEWSVVIPFPLTPLVLAFFLHRIAARRSRLDVGIGQLSWNVVRTLAASVSTALLISGFPLLASASAGPSISQAELGAFLLAVTLTRAPIAVPLMSMQSYLVVQFRTRSGRLGRLVVGFIGIVAGAAVVLALFAWAIGAPVFAWLFGAEYQVEPIVLGALVLSSFGIGALCISGPAVLARGMHAAYSGGWIVAAAATLGIMLLPFELVPRALAALLLGPLTGLLVHVAGLAVARGRRRTG